MVVTARAGGNVEDVSQRFVALDWLDKRWGDEGGGGEYPVVLGEDRALEVAAAWERAADAMEAQP